MNASTLFFSLAVWSAAATAALAEISHPAVARLLRTSGTYQVLDPLGNPRDLDARGAVFEGEIIQMGPNAQAMLVFSTGTVAKLTPDTIVRIDELRQEPSGTPAPALRSRATETTDSSIQIRLYHGSVVSDIQPLRQDSTYAIHTPLGTAGVRGTVMETGYENPNWSEEWREDGDNLDERLDEEGEENPEDGDFTVKVSEGTVVVTETDGDEYEVNEGESYDQSDSDGDGNPDSRVTGLTQAEKDRLEQERQDLEDLRQEDPDMDEPDEGDDEGQDEDEDGQEQPQTISDPDIGGPFTINGLAS